MHEAAMWGVIAGAGIVLGYVGSRIITVLVQIRDELTAIRNAKIRDTEVNPDV